jgi:hypothetical protein
MEIKFEVQGTCGAITLAHSKGVNQRWRNRPARLRNSFHYILLVFGPLIVLVERDRYFGIGGIQYGFAFATKQNKK